MPLTPSRPKPDAQDSSVTQAFKTLVQITFGKKTFLEMMCQGADHLTSEGGGGGGGWVILKKNILQVHMHKKKILAQDHRAKKISCTYSGLEKKFWQNVP